MLSVCLLRVPWPPHRAHCSRLVECLTFWQRTAPLTSAAAQRQAGANRLLRMLEAASFLGLGSPLVPQSYLAERLPPVEACFQKRSSTPRPVIAPASL